MKKIVFILLAVMCVVALQANTIVPLNKSELKELKTRYKNEIKGIKTGERGVAGDFVYYVLRDKRNEALAMLNENKEIIRMLSWDENFKTIENIVDGDSSYYFMNSGKGRTVAILNKARNPILKFGSYGEKVTYVPARKAGVECDSSYGRKYWIPIPETKAVFFVEGNAVYRTDGTPIVKSEIPCYKKGGMYISGYPSNKCIFYYELRETIDETRSKYGIYTLDGMEIVPLEEQYIGEISEYDIGIGGISQKLLHFIEVRKNTDGVEYKGAYPLMDSDKEEYGIVPAEYYDIRYRSHFDTARLEYRNVLMVQKTSFDEYEVYSKESGYKASDRDMGEHYYKAHLYDKVIEYYSTSKEIKPWAAFYSGVSFYKKAEEINNNIHMLHFWMYDKQGDPYQIPIIQKYLDESLLDINLMLRFYAQASDLIEYYINSGDQEFLNAYISASFYLNSSKKYADTENSDYKAIVKDNNEAIAWLQQREAAKQAELERRRQEKAAFWGAFLQGFVEGLSNSLTGGTSSSYSSGSVSSQTTPSYNTSSSAASSSSYSSSSSGDSGDAVGKAKAESRIRELKNHINNYEKLLKDAEAFEAKCRAEHSYFLGQAITDVTNYKKKIKEYQDEMNKLKLKYGL